MKVFQIQCIVPDLIDVVSLEIRLTNLELDRENHRAGNDSRIEPAAQPRHVVFQKDCSVNARERSLQHSCLLNPCIPLLRFDSVIAPPCDFPEHLVRTRADECPDIRGIVGVCGEKWWHAVVA